MHLHLVLLVRHAPEVASLRLHPLTILKCDLEVLHLELPSEEHTLIALALGLQLVPVGVVLALVPRRMVWWVVWWLLVADAASEAAGDSVWAVLQVGELPLDRLVELLEDILLLLFAEAHLIHGLLERLPERRLQVNVVVIEFAGGLALALLWPCDLR